MQLFSPIESTDDKIRALLFDNLEDRHITAVYFWAVTPARISGNMRNFRIYLDGVSGSL